MKKLLAILFLLNLTVSAQTIFEKSWNSPYSLTVSDVATDGMGNRYFACSGNNMFIDSTMSVVVKVNADFEVAWANWYRTLRRDDLGSIEVLADGNILLGGTMRQEFAFDVGGGLIKIDPDGAVIWQKMYNGSFDERIIHTSEMASGNIVSVIRYGVSSQPSSVLVTDSEGSLQARYELFDDGTGVQIEDVVKSDSDTFYATGEIFDNSVSRNVPFIMAFTETEALWFKKYDVGETSAAYSISVNENSDISIAGTRFDPESLGKSVNGLILRTDADGVVYDAVRIYREGNGFNESTSGIEIRDNGSVVVGLNFLSENGFLPILAEINLDATLNWSSAIESGGGTSFSFRLTLEDNRLLTVGRNLIGQVRLNARASDGQAPCNEVSVDIDLEEITPMVINSPLEFDLVKAFTTELPIEVIPWEIDESEICSEVVSTKEYVEIPVEVFPNPAQDRVQLIIPSGYDKLEIYSIDGKKIDQVNVSIGMNQLDIADFPSGIYILLFSGDSGMVSTKISKL